MIADIVALDRDDRPLLVADVKAGLFGSDFESRLGSLLKMMEGLDAPFGMLMDLEEMIFFRRDIEHPNSVVLQLKTTNVLRHYSPEFAGKETRYGSRLGLHDYMTSLAGSWLRDLAYRWKPGTPPGMDALAGIGLLERLDGGSTRSEVEIGGLSLR